ncbi:MAG TPA: NAD(P)-binding protein [Candidatus Nanopelagicaceae bacterium]|nr:NAD(P)-binding protein [Candidatus Nanopelagicaceae bacterium]
MGKPFAITLDIGSSLANHTGSWRTERPVYVHRLPPCNDACPAGEDIQGWLYDGEAGNYESAWRHLTRDNPLPAIMGRICYHPCQTACNRAELDETVGINSVERFLGDHAISKDWQFTVEAPPSGKKILVIGSGPSGLSAAYHLALKGHQVTIRESAADPGGMMRYGIPAYRLPREVLDAEISRITNMGVVIECNSKVEDASLALDEGFDAVFLAIGAHLGRRAFIPAGDTAHILDAVSMLHMTAEGEPPLLGRRVVVYGGGNTALDAARTARRLGAYEAVVVYRRNRERMPAHEVEINEALDEGIIMRWLSTISWVNEGLVTVEKMELDDKGFPQPTGEFETLEADSVILALGQEVDLSLIENIEGVSIDDGVIQVDEYLMTGRNGLFAGGDAVPGERTATNAIGHGKQAARAIDAWLQGEQFVHAPRPDMATFDRLNTWYYSDAPRTVRGKLDAARRATNFDEVVQGLDEQTALFEARRCLSCGNCFSCDNCFGVCPDNAVIKFGEGNYEFNLDYCKGCGICATECPSGAIDMEPELS